MHSKYRTYYCVILIALSGFSCIDRETIAGTGKILPDKILGTDGDNQIGAVGSEAFQQLAVRVLDQKNQPVSKVPVVFHVQEGTASPADTVVTTNYDGYARIKLTYGMKAEDIIIHAIAQGLKGSPAIFKLRSVAIGAGIITALSDTILHGRVQESNRIRVNVTDVYKNPVNAIVIFSPKLHSGSVTNYNVVTDSFGNASTYWIFDTLAGKNELEVSVAGKNVQPAIFTANVKAGDAARLIILSGANQFGFINEPLPLDVEVAVTDKFGNFRDSTNVQFSNYGKPGGPTMQYRYDDTSLIPARTVASIVLSSNIGANHILASRPPAISIGLQFNGYLKVLLRVPTSTSGNVNLQWDKNLNPNFGSYRLYRSTTQGVTSSSTLIEIITDENVTDFIDTTTVPGTKYFYRLNMQYANGESFFSNEIDITP